jgi:hypothetical protein
VSWRLDDSVCSKAYKTGQTGYGCQDELWGVDETSLRYNLINLNLCRRLSVVIHHQIISIQFRDQNSRYCVKRGWKLPDLSKTVRAAQFKYVEGRDSCNIKAPGSRVVNRVVSVSQAGHAVQYLAGVRIHNNDFPGLASDDEQAMVSFVKRDRSILLTFLLNRPGRDHGAFLPVNHSNSVFGLHVGEHAGP